MKLDYTPQQLAEMANTLRMDVVDSIHCARSGHPGGSLSAAEMLAVLYFREMDIDPEKPVYYAALARRGYFPVEELKTLRKIGSPLQGHPDRKKVRGVDMSTGSLGQGISAAAGMACYAKKNGDDFRVYCVLGDGEMQEGEVWEALMSAAHYGLSNLTVLLDNNNLQIDGAVDKVMSIYPVKEKVEAFGWSVFTADGHDAADICRVLDEARQDTQRPSFIICRTVKGKGVSFMENQAGWHGAAINDEQYETAMSELRANGRE